MDDHGWRDWPDDLQVKAFRLLAALRTRDQAAWEHSFALRKLAKADWSAFTTAYAEWRAA
jgi:hypothetical protein